MGKKKNKRPRIEEPTPPSTSKEAANIPMTAGHGKKRDDARKSVAAIRRLTPWIPRKRGRFHICLGSSMSYQLAKCREMLETGSDQITLAGIGRAVRRVEKIARLVEEIFYFSVSLTTKRGTVTVTDDLIASGDTDINDSIDKSHAQRQRTIPSIEIIVRKKPLRAAVYDPKASRARDD